MSGVQSKASMSKVRLRGFGATCWYSFSPVTAVGEQSARWEPTPSYNLSEFIKVYFIMFIFIV